MKLNNKGFSILRIIIIIVLVVLLILLAQPGYKYISNYVKKISYKNNISTLETIANDYASDHANEFTSCHGGTVTNSCVISINTLKSNDYIYDDDLLKDPFTKLEYKGDFLICYSGENSFRSKYIDGTSDLVCDNSNDVNNNNNVSNEVTNSPLYDQIQAMYNKIPSNFISSGNELRFTGKVNNNYVLFNNENWRILGIVNNKIKITQNKPINFINFSDGTLNYGESNIRVYLNNDSYYNDLSNSDKKMISTSNWGTGSCTDLTGCVSNDSGSSWTGNFGILSIRDYALLSSCQSLESSCLNNGFLNIENEFLINNNGYGVYKTDSSGVISSVRPDQSANARPTVYLDSKTMILSGSGTSYNPFELGMGE